MKHLVLCTRVFTTFIAIILPSVLSAQEVVQSELVQISSPWAIASVGTMRPTAAYLTVVNTGKKMITITGVVSEVAGRSSIHETSVSADGVGTMRPVEEVHLSPGGTLEFKPGSYHIMLMELNEPLLEGASTSLSLIFDDGSQKLFSVPILSIGARSADAK